MRVWHVYASPRMGPVNGVIQAVHQLAAAQRSIGLEVHILHGTDNDPLTGPTSGSGRGLHREARRLGAATPPDVIHLHELFRPPHLALAPMLARTPYVVSTHGAASAQNLARYRSRKALYGRVVERHLAGRADALVALTDQESSDVQAWLPGGPTVHVVPNVADPQLADAAPWQPRTGCPRGPVVSLARFDVRHKGLDRVAEIAASLPAVDFDVHGSRCGNEPELLRELIERAPTNLRLAEPLQGPAKEAMLRNASAFILLSRWEGLSMALLEALALGVPCLVSPEVAETLGPEAPVIVVPHDARAASEVVAGLLDDPAAQVAAGRAGRRWVRSHASPIVVAHATESAYRAALDAAGA